MITSTIGTMTLEELLAIIRQVVHEMQDEPSNTAKHSPLELPLVDVGEWKEGVELIKRDDF